MSPDVVVIGAGTAGLTAAIRLAERGARVLVLASGEGALPLATGQVDVLGYAPDLVEDPLQQISAVNESHPYRRVGQAEVQGSLHWFLETAAPLGYEGSLHRNRLQPTALGGLRPTCLVPESMAAGDLSAGAQLLVVGLSGFRDFYPRLAAENLSRVRLPRGGQIAARAVEVGLPGDARDLRPQLLARRLEQHSVRAQLARDIRSELRQERVVGLPAVLGLEHGHEVWQELQELIGRPVVEIPTPPPSLPGQRLQLVFLRALRRAGGELRVGTAVTGHRAQGDRVEAVTVADAARVNEIRARDFVLAAGGLGTGGIVLGPNGERREPIFDLFLQGRAGPPDDHYFAPQPDDGAGVAVDQGMRPLNQGGEPAFRNLRAVGAMLAGAEPWREKSGEGISLATGFAAATAITEVAA